MTGWIVEKTNNSETREVWTRLRLARTSPAASAQ